MQRIQELKDLITKYDTAYRQKEALVTDTVYDALVDELVELIGEDDPFFDSSVKEDVPSERREPLPKDTVLASMSKVKTIDDIRTWMRLKGIPDGTQFIISPKYDGCSLLKEEATKKAWTKGSKDNSGGLRSDEHLKYMNDVAFDAPYTFGEVIISRENWLQATESFEGDSARNGVAGLFRRDYTSDELQYVDFIRYGVIGKTFSLKNEMFDYLNAKQKSKVPYVLASIDDMTEESLKSIFIDFTKNYELDGLIIEVNDISKWANLGRERNGNPKWAVAYKGSFEEIGETVCTAIEDNISKDGNIIPVAILEPIKLDGAVISRVTLNNYTFMKEMGIGVGSRVKVKRSGMVIPLITEVIDKKELVMPNIECYWSGVHLKTTHETDEQKKKKIFAFFQILGVENVSDKTFDLLFDSGFKTIKEILSMSKADFLGLERFGDRKAEIVYEAIHSKLKNVPLAKLQHATGLFKQLGSKKLALVEHFETVPTLKELLLIEGYSEISANNYLLGIAEFWEFIKDFPITWSRTKKIEATSNEFEGKSFVFTGYRNKEAEVEIVKRGGTIASGVSKKTTYLVMAEKGSGSSKETKALELGVTVLDKEELLELIK
jgi:DNA ligase (NAD+)